MEARWAKLSSSETSAARICPGDKPGRPQKDDAGTRSNPVRMCREETPANGGAGPAYYGDKYHPPWRIAMNEKHAMQVQAETYLDQDGVEKLHRVRVDSRQIEIAENIDQWLGPDYRLLQSQGKRWKTGVSGFALQPSMAEEAPLTSENDTPAAPSIGTAFLRRCGFSFGCGMMAAFLYLPANRPGMNCVRYKRAASGQIRKSSARRSVCHHRGSNR